MHVEREHRRPLWAGAVVALGSLALSASPVIAQDGLEGLESIVDRSEVERVDIDPTTGDVLHWRDDAVIGEGDRAFRLRRVYRPWAGDLLNTGTHWVTPFDLHLDVSADLSMASFVDAQGARRQFRLNADGELIAIHGQPAQVEIFDDGFILTGLGDERTYVFDTGGYLIRRSGPRAYELTYRYDDHDCLVEVAGPWGSLTLERDAGGILTAVVLPDESRVEYARNDYGDLLEVRRGASVARYDYDADGRLTGLADGAATLHYDAAGRAVALRGDAVRPLELAYAQSDDPQRALEVTVKRAGTTQHVLLSADGLRREIVDADGTSTVIELDRRWRMKRLTGANGTFETTYDERGRVLAQDSPEGRVEYDYDSRVTDRPTQIRLADGRAIDFTYDLSGNLLAVTAPGGATTRYTYDALGRVASLTNPRGGVVSFDYDARGYVVATHEPASGTTRFRRDDLGRVLAVKREDGRLVQVQRDLMGRVVEVSDALGVLQAYTYDARGNLLTAQGELGQTFDYRYDDLGQLTQVREAGSLVMQVTYDADGRTSTLEDALGNVTRFERPDAHTLVIQDPTRGTVTRHFDAQGRLLEETQAGVTIGYERDARGNVVARTTPAGRETFAYDPQGRLVSMQGPDGGFELAYDPHGRVAALRDLELEQDVAYRYDEAGDRVGLELPWGEVAYEHDTEGRLTAATLPSGERIEFELHADGRRKEIRYPNGVTTNFRYFRGRLTEVTTARGETVLDRRAYGYTDAGRVAWVEDASGQRTTYGHDDRGRLTRVEGPQGTQTFSYDLAGNPADDGAEVSEGNRLVTHQGAHLRYDASGALTSVTRGDQTTRYVYDHDDKLVAVEQPDGETIRYGYAPNGARLWREDGQGRQRYLLDAAQVVGIYDADGELESSFVYGNGVDDVLSADHQDERHFYHYDLLRSVTSLTDSDGDVSARYAYGPWGQQEQAEGAAAQWNPFQFSSRPFDAESGLLDLRARNYDPTLGRFTTPDPLGQLGGINLYTYVENDPTRLTDPWGLKPWWERAWDGVVSATEAVVDFGESAVRHTAAFGEVLWEDLKSGAVRDRIFAFGRGFGQGLWSAGKGLVNTVLHPIETFNGIVYAIENWEETKEAFGAMWDEYVDAFHNDPERFAEMTGNLTAQALVAVVGTKGLGAVSRSAAVARIGTGAANVARTAGGPVARVASRVGSTVGARAPGLARTAHRARVMSRARDIELARRAAMGGGFLTRNGRRVANFGRDVARLPGMAVRNPGAFTVYTGTRLARGAGELVAATGRGTWTATRRFGIPTVLVFNDQISDAINRHETREDASRAVRTSGQALLDDAADLSPEDMARRLAEVGTVYEGYRNRLLAPVHEEDQALDQRLNELDAAVERGEVDPSAIDARLEAMLDEYARRRHNLMTDLYERSRDVEHDMLNPSPNRTLSFQDEIDLLNAVRERTSDPAVRAMIDARIADVDAMGGHEYELFRQGDHDLLIAGIAGPPRDEGMDAPAPGLGGMTEIFEEGMREE